MRSGDLESSLEPPASVFAPQSRSQQRTVPVAELQHLLGVSQPDCSSNLQSGFSSALMPGPAEAKGPDARSSSASAGPHPKSVRFGDAVDAEEATPPSCGAASLEDPKDTDFENAQVRVSMTLLKLGPVLARKARSCASVDCRTEMSDSSSFLPAFSSRQRVS